MLPLPSSLSTQIRPPCSSTSRFESASPSPVPSRCLAAGVGLLELLEDPVLILGRDARAGVGDGDLTSPFDPRGGHVDAAALRA